MSTEVTEEVIEAFIGRRAGKRGLSRTAHLFDTGVISSLFLIELLSFLKTRFDLRIAVEDLDIEAFATIERIAQFVDRGTP